MSAPFVLYANSAAGFHHLDKVLHSKFVNSRYAARMPRPGRKYTAPKDRIRRWNIVPGDKVRLMVGKPEEKYDTTKQGKDGAKGKVWRVYTVSGVNMVHNRVYLDGLTNVRSNRTQPLPSEEKLAKMTEDERHSYLQQRNFISQRRAVHYSSVQLCVRDAGADSVFATRVATTAPFYDRATRSARWARYAAALSGDGSMLPRDPARDQVRIPWPITQPKEKADPMPVDTLERASAASTLNLQDASRIPRPLIPVSLRGPAPGPQDQDWADEYVFAPESRTSPELEAALPLYLQEELSPRYSRAKQIKGWNQRRAAEAEAREAYVAAAVDEWEAGGRDRGLEELLTLDAVRLEGITLRPRTRQEIRDAAGREFDTQLAHTRKLTRRAAAAGMRFVEGQWVPGAKGEEIQRKKSRKERKLRKIEERLNRIKLEDAPNQAIPLGH